MLEPQVRRNITRFYEKSGSRGLNVARKFAMIVWFLSNTSITDSGGASIKDSGGDMRQKRARVALTWLYPLIVLALGGSAILTSTGCGGSSDSGGTGGSGTLRVNATFAPSTSKEADGFIGSLQVTVKNSAGEVQGSPACLTRSSTSAQFDNLADGSGYVVEVKGYRATNCSGDVLASANIGATVNGSSTPAIDVSANLSTAITSVTIEPQGIAPFDPGASATFSATAKAGSTVVLTSAQDSSFVYSVTPASLGTINQSTGVFTAANNLNADTAGTVSVALKGFSASSAISVKAAVGQAKFKVKWGKIEYKRDVAGYAGGVGVVLTNTSTGLAIPAFFARPADANATEQEYFIGGPNVQQGAYTLQVEAFTGNTDANRGNSLGIVTVPLTVPVTAANEPVISDRLDGNISRIVISYWNGGPWTDVPVGGTINTFIGQIVDLDARAIDSSGNALFFSQWIQFTVPAGNGVVTVNDPAETMTGVGLGSTTLTAKAGIATGPSATANVVCGPSYVVAYQFFDFFSDCQNIGVTTDRNGNPGPFLAVADWGNTGNYSDSVNYPDGFGFGNDFQVIEPAISADGSTLAFVVDILQTWGNNNFLPTMSPAYGKDICTIDIIYNASGDLIGLQNARRQSQPNDGYEDRMPTFNPKAEGGKMMIYWSSMYFDQAIDTLWFGNGGIDGQGWPSVRKIFKKGKLDGEGTRIQVTGGSIGTGGAEGNHFWPAINPDGTVLAFIQKLPNNAFLRANDTGFNGWPRSNSATSPFWDGRQPEIDLGAPGPDNTNSTVPIGPYTDDAGNPDGNARYPGQIVLFDLTTGSTATSPEININQRYRLAWRPTKFELFAVRNIAGNDRIDALENAVIGSPLNVFRQTQTGVVAPFAAIIANPLLAGFHPQETLAYREPSGQIKFRTELDTPNLVGNNYPDVGLGTNTVFPVPNR